MPRFVDYFDNILDSIREPLIILDADLTVVKANQSFARTFRIDLEETRGTRIFDLGNKQWDFPKLRELLAKPLSQEIICENCRIEHTFHDIGRKIMHMHARLIPAPANRTQLILMTIEDVTDREERSNTLAELVEKQTAELHAARREAEKKQEKAEAALREIQELKDLLEAERAYLQAENNLETHHEKIIGQSDALKYVLYKIEQIAGSNTTVLILGETGTGKELVARAVHDMSLRKNRALFKVNCATLPANLIESELFGHEKGSFTGSWSRHLGRFEVADGATLFLDEIGELPIELQAKLLRFIQDGEFERLGSSRTIKVDTRIIAATNRNLEEEVRMGRFREDLWYRLNVFPITLPPLRDRLDDIPLLVDFHVKSIAKRLGRPIDIIPVSVMAALQDYHWPGNIRELENVLERAVINSSGRKLRLVDALKKPLKFTNPGAATLESVEREYILRVLEQTRWKVSGKGSAAQILGLDRSTLRARMAKLRIEKPH